MVGLGDLPGGDFHSEALGVSADGSIVVGRGTAASGPAAFIWDQTNGMRDLRDVLVNDYGLDLTDWVLTQAEAISGDGFAIVGYGTNPTVETEGWIAMLVGPEAVPSVSPVGLALLGGLVFTIAVGGLAVQGRRRAG